MLLVEKFKDPQFTSSGDKRASVELVELKTLWFNTGTQCNLTCKHCYIESSPTNDKLSYISLKDIIPYLEEIKNDQLATTEIAFTGGEPFINPHIIPMLTECLVRGFEILVLSNGMNVIKKHQAKLLQLKEKYQDKVKIRISLDHYTQDVHEQERGIDTFNKAIETVNWLSTNQFNISIAGRGLTNETTLEISSHYQKLLHEFNIPSEKLIVFPEIDASEDVPEISISCWDILNKKPEQQMCANSRMVVKRRGQELPVVLACTLITRDSLFELGQTLADSKKSVSLCHSSCSKFCVLGGASCSA